MSVESGGARSARLGSIRLGAAIAWLIAGGVTLIACDDSASGPDRGDGGAAGAGGAAGDAGAGENDGGGGMGSTCRGDECACIGDDQCPTEMYCHKAVDGDLEGICRPGCREVGGCLGTCDLESRACTCATDEHCQPGTYCDESARCVIGCARDTDCDAEDRCELTTHACEAAEICCGDVDQCERVSAGQCQGQALEGAPRCELRPCGPPCEADADCEAGRFCNDAGRCQDGCRLGEADDCEPPRACDASNHQCRRIRCEDDEDCHRAYYCDPVLSVCQDGCRAGGCPEADETCNEALRICTQGCDAARPCPDPEATWCDLNLEACRPYCDGHPGCQSGEACTALEGGICVAGACRDDLEDEPNDDFASATVPELADGVVFIADRHICPGDADTYRFELPPGGQYQIRLDFNHGEGDLDLFVFDAGEVPIGESAQLMAPEIFTERDRVDGGTLYFTVRGADEDVANTYSVLLQVRFGEAGVCFDDALDTPAGDGPDDDEPDGAVRVGDVEDILVVESLDRHMCPGDEDWLCFQMGEDDGLDVQVTGGEGEGDLIVEIYSDFTREQRGLGVPDHASEGGPDPSISVAQKSGGFGQPGAARGWCLRVRGDGDETDREYNITLTFSRDAVPCEADLGEPNDTRRQATDLLAMNPLVEGGALRPGRDLEVPMDLRICPRDRDVFEIAAAAGNILRAWVEIDGALALPLHVRLLDASGAPIGVEGSGADGRVEARLNGTVAGTYYVEVFGELSVAGDYTLFLRREVLGEGCGVDFTEIDERNDTVATATELDVSGGQARFPDGVLCNAVPPQSDQDWYCFEVAEDRSRVSVHADFLNAQTNVDIELFRGRQSMGSLADGRTRLDGELVNLFKQLVDRGDYCVRVFGRDGAEGPYQLTVTVVPEGLECAPDYREGGGGNDDQNSPTDLGAGSNLVGDAWVCVEEREAGDWYTFEVAPRSHMSAHVEFLSEVDGHLLVNSFARLDSDPTLAIGNLLRGDHQCIEIDNRTGAAEAVQLQIKIDRMLMDGDARVDYVLRIVPSNVADCDALSRTQGRAWGELTLD